MQRLPHAVIGEINAALDQMHEDCRAVGKKLYQVFRPERNNVSTQVRNLEQVTYSAVRIGQVEQFLKNQMGRATDNGKAWRQVGPELLTQLDKLRSTAEELRHRCKELDEAHALALRLQLARGWIRMVVAEYMYQFALQQMERAS